jgi:hypothetical protein
MQASGEETRGAVLFPASRVRMLRAAGVAGIWIVGLLPLLFGRAACPLADIFGIPCPGCGMTRAMLLLASGQVAASLRMHPLAVPCAFASTFFMVATIWVTARAGTPEAAWHDKVGRAALLVFALVQVAMLALWGARMFGLFGGRAPV